MPGRDLSRALDKGLDRVSAGKSLGSNCSLSSTSVQSTPEEPTKVGAGLKTATLPWVLSGKGRCQWANCFDINRPCRVRAYSAISCPRQIRDGVVNHGPM